MSVPGTVGWFARHEARLAWRDWLWLMTGGYRRRARTVALGFLVFALFMHGLAYLMLSHSAFIRRPARHSHPGGHHRHADADLVVDAVPGN